MKKFTVAMKEQESLCNLSEEKVYNRYVIVLREYLLFFSYIIFLIILVLSFSIIILLRKILTLIFGDVFKFNLFTFRQRYDGSESLDRVAKRDCCYTVTQAAV